MLNDRINEEISLGVLWRMATRFSSANKRALRTRARRGDETRRAIPSTRFFLVGHFTLEIIHADTKKVVPLAAPDAWIFSTLWRVITQSSRSIIPRPSCEFYMKKNLPLSFCALRSHFLFLPSFLSFFFLHLLSSFYHSLRKRRKNGDVFHKKGTRVKKKKKKR